MSRSLLPNDLHHDLHESAQSQVCLRVIWHTNVAENTVYMCRASGHVLVRSSAVSDRVVSITDLQKSSSSDTFMNACLSAFSATRCLVQLPEYFS